MAGTRWPRWKWSSGRADPSGLQVSASRVAPTSGEREAEAAHPGGHTRPALRAPGNRRDIQDRGVGAWPASPSRRWEVEGQKGPWALHPSLGALRSAGSHAATTSKAWRVLRAPRGCSCRSEAAAVCTGRQGGPASIVSVCSGRKNGSPDKSSPTEAHPAHSSALGLWPRLGRPAGAQQETGWAGRAPADRSRAKVHADPEPLNTLEAAPGPPTARDGLSLRRGPRSHRETRQTPNTLTGGLHAPSGS